MNDGFRVITIDVEDRRLDGFGDIGRITRETAIARVGGEANLIVDDDVDRPAGAVGFKLRHEKRFGDDALAGEGGVAVHQDGDGAFAVVVALAVLLGADHPFDDRVDQLEMAGIGGEAQWDRFCRCAWCARWRTRGDISHRRRRQFSPKAGRGPRS